jgi:phosphatidylinositol alpha-1,6-mannosyltransferase
VNAERFRPDAAARAEMRARWGLSADAEIVFTAGRFVRKKGFEYLIDAVATLSIRRPRVALVLAGGGDLEAEFRNRLIEQGLAGRSVLTGVLSQDDIARALAAADVVAVPSVRDDAGNVDGLPNVVMEALASGTPLVATSAGGIGAVVADGATGLIVAERDAAGLAAAIESVLADGALGAKLGGSARQWAIEHGGWDRTAEAFDAVYDRVDARHDA